MGAPKRNPKDSPAKTPPLNVSRTALDRKSVNVHEVHDTVIVLFDTPFASDDKPDKDAFELASEKKKMRKTRAATETIDEKHVAIRFEGLKPGLYALARDEEHGWHDDLFERAQYPYVAPPAMPLPKRGSKNVPPPKRTAPNTGDADDALKGLVGLGHGPAQYLPKQFFVVIDKPPTPDDEELGGAAVYFPKVVAEEPKLGRPVAAPTPKAE